MEATVDYFLSVIGMVMIVEGLPYFAIPDKMKQWIRQIIDVPDASLRRVALGVMLLGLGLVYAGNR
jgi:uncharacterized protein YjeT (DUF2065 family)